MVSTKDRADSSAPVGPASAIRSRGGFFLVHRFGDEDIRRGLALAAITLAFAKPTLAFDISGQYGFGSFADWTVHGLNVPAPEVTATSFTLRLGARLYLR